MYSIVYINKCKDDLMVYRLLPLESINRLEGEQDEKSVIH